jgi:hypothetical protein
MLKHHWRIGMATDLNQEKIGSGGWAIQVTGPLAGVLGLVLLGTIVYAIYTRSIADFVRVPLVSSVGMTVLMFIASLSPRNIPRSFSAAWSNLKQIAVMWLFSAVISLLMYSVGVLALDTIERASGVITGKGQFSILVGVATAFAGGLLFWVRSKWRVTYGVSEAFAGVAIASHRAYREPSLWTPSDFGFYAAVLTAGIYLVVRGLDNVNQGRGSPGDPMVMLGNWLKDKTFTTDPDELAEMSGHHTRRGD